MSQRGTPGKKDMQMGAMPSRLPHIFIANGAFRRLKLYTDLCPFEVGGLGTVEPFGNDLLVTHIFLVRQRVSDTDTELDPQALADHLLQPFKGEGTFLPCGCGGTATPKLPFSGARPTSRPLRLFKLTSSSPSWGTNDASSDAGWICFRQNGSLSIGSLSSRYLARRLTMSYPSGGRYRLNYVRR